MKAKTLLIFLLATIWVSAQKSMTLSECEQTFEKNNLQLLAKHYDIDISKAGEILAKTWDTPYLTGEINLYRPIDKSFLNVGSDGQKALAIQQLIVLGGKRHREVIFNQSNTELAELQFEQLLHNLKLELETSFYSLYFDNNKLTNNDMQSTNMDNLIASYQIQNLKGNLPLKDLVRLENISFNLKNDRMELTKSILSSREALSLLTGITDDIQPVVPEETLITNLCQLAFIKDSLLAIAYENNPDYLLSVKSIDNGEKFLKWQKSKYTPDLTLGAAYDQNSGAFTNQLNLTFGIGLPLWNKNKGGVRMAKAQLEQTRANSDFLKLELQTSIIKAFTYFSEEQKQYNQLPKTSEADLKTIYNGVLTNFSKRNISLIEFTDYMESFNQSVMQINELRKQLILSGMQLNHIVSKEIVKP